MKKLKTVILGMALLFSPIGLATGAETCYPCGEEVPGVACPPNDTECEIEETASGYKVTCSPSGTGAVGKCLNNVL